MPSCGGHRILEPAYAPQHPALPGGACAQAAGSQVRRRSARQAPVPACPHEIPPQRHGGPALGRVLGLDLDSLDLRARGAVDLPGAIVDHRRRRDHSRLPERPARHGDPPRSPPPAPVRRSATRRSRSSSPPTTRRPRSRRRSPTRSAPTTRASSRSSSPTTARRTVRARSSGAWPRPTTGCVSSRRRTEGRRRS